MKRENRCCPYLAIIDCGDTDKHRHLLCRKEGNIKSNEVIKVCCLEKFEHCLAFEEVKQ